MLLGMGLANECDSPFLAELVQAGFRAFLIIDGSYPKALDQARMLQDLGAGLIIYRTFFSRYYADPVEVGVIARRTFSLHPHGLPKHIVFDNEPDLYLEQPEIFDQAKLRAFLQKWVKWFISAAKEVRKSVPDAVIHLPGLSEPDPFLLEYRGERLPDMFEVLRPAVAWADVVDLHLYWGGEADWQEGIDKCGARTEAWYEAFPDKPLHITEFGNFAAGRQDTPQQHAQFFRQMIYFPRMKAAFPFIWGSYKNNDIKAGHPQNNLANYPGGHRAYLKAFAAAAAMPAPQPPPPPTPTPPPPLPPPTGLAVALFDFILDRQRSMARAKAIEVEILAALAQVESEWDYLALGDWTDDRVPEAFGLYQFHSRGLGRGYPLEILLDIEDSTVIAAREVRRLYIKYNWDLTRLFIAWNYGEAKANPTVLDPAAVARVQPYLKAYAIFKSQGIRPLSPKEYRG